MNACGLCLDLWGKPVWLVGNHSGVQKVEFSKPETFETTSSEKPNWQNLALEQWSAYLEGRCEKFTIPLDRVQKGAFGEAVLGEVQNIPPGRSLTYGEVAVRCGSPGAARAVGQLMARNPLPILIPCHRVVGANGKLTGYSGPGGIAFKKWLLEKELEVF